jgi:hypothetical protein
MLSFLLVTAAAVLLLFTRDPEEVYKQLSRSTFPFIERKTLPPAAQYNTAETLNSVANAGITCLPEPCPDPLAGPNIVAGDIYSALAVAISKAFKECSCGLSTIVLACGSVLFSLFLAVVIPWFQVVSPNRQVSMSYRLLRM